MSNFFKLGIDFAVLFAPTTDTLKAKEDSSWNRYLKILYMDTMRKNVRQHCAIFLFKKSFFSIDRFIISTR
jgi:hypothetical protein